VKAARKAIATTPGAADAMRADWRKEAAFLARFGVTQAQFRHGVPAGAVEITDDEDAVERTEDRHGLPAGDKMGFPHVAVYKPRWGTRPNNVLESAFKILDGV
jgi:hypothetical protein